MTKRKVLNLGIKKVSSSTFFKLIILPKIFTDLLDEDRYVLMELVGETLMITPLNSSDLEEVE